MSGILLAALGTFASAGVDVLYQGDIWGGKTIDVGNIYAILNYDANDTTLEIKYVTENGWRMEECQLETLTTPPAGRGSPGHYSYKSGDINTTEYSFHIPIADLHALYPYAADGVWGQDVYFLPHTSVWRDDGDGIKEEGEQGETGYGGDVVIDNPWYGYFYITLIKPTPTGNDPEPFEGATYTRGYWQRYWWTPTAKKPNPPRIWTDEFKAEALPGTLAGEYFSTPLNFYDWLKTPVEGDMFIQFEAQLIALHCNLKLTEDLGGAIYNDYNQTGEPFEEMSVQAIYDSANKYNRYTDQTLLTELKDVMDAINNNYESIDKVLWQGGMGQVTNLGNPARLSVSPNPFSATVRIQFQQGLNANSRVSVYDRAGNKVNELTVSNNEVVWNGTDANGRKLTAGVYLLKAEGAQGASARVVISR
jgi:hypothetical protein